jgi:dCMP deaminase
MDGRKTGPTQRTILTPIFQSDFRLVDWIFNRMDDVGIIDRPPVEEVAMQTAELWAQRSTCPKKHVGAVLLTVTGRVLLTGYNGAPNGMPHCTDIGCDLDANGDCVRSIHAEANILALAARVGLQVSGTVMYITHFPCFRCAQLIAAAGLSHIIFKYDRPPDDVRVKSINILWAAGIDALKLESISEDT